MEYVPKTEVKVIKIIFNRWIGEIRPIIREKGITFIVSLVGSAKRNMVTRDHNKGFDCDYQIFIQRNKKELNPKEIKNLFINSFNQIVKKDGYDNCEDSTLAITIKKTNKSKSQIINGFDIVIFENRDGESKVLRFNKKDNVYSYEFMQDMTASRVNFKKINGAKMWTELRKIYLEKKNNNIDNKKSFQILNEAVNEIIQSS